MLSICIHIIQHEVKLTWIEYSKTNLEKLQLIILNLEPYSSYKLLQLWDRIGEVWSQEESRYFFSSIFQPDDNTAKKIRNYLVDQVDIYWQQSSNKILTSLKII